MDVGIERLAAGCPNLNHLNLYGCYLSLCRVAWNRIQQQATANCFICDTQGHCNTEGL